MKNATSEWLLFDGALAEKCADGHQLRKLKGAVPLYRDFGQEAAAVGPWLLAKTPDACQLLDQWQASREDAVFGIAWLTSDVTQTTLQEHLLQMRYVRSAHQPNKRYFLRYADTRCLGALWPSLRLVQQTTLLGPVTAWRWQQLNGSDICLRPPASQEHLQFPLPIRGKQFQAMADEARVGSLVVETRQFFPELSEKYSLGQRYDAAKAFLRWNRRHSIESPEYQMTILLAAAQTNGEVFESASLTDVVQQAQQQSNSRAILDWAATQPLPQHPVGRA